MLKGGVGMHFLLPKGIEIRQYAAIDTETAQWITGDDFKLYNGNYSFWLRVLKNNKRRTIAKEYLILPCTLSFCIDRDENGQYIYQAIDIRRLNFSLSREWYEAYDQQKRELGKLIPPKD